MSTQQNEELEKMLGMVESKRQLQNAAGKVNHYIGVSM